MLNFQRLQGTIEFTSISNRKERYYKHMAQFLTTTGTSYSIENIIIESKRKLMLLSPYLQLSKTLFERLKDADSRGVTIKIIYGKDDLNPKEKKSLCELKNLELLFFRNLHAKCYFNEEKMVITSMNMYEFSEKNNREMGVLIDQLIDKELFEKAVYETLSIIQSSERISPKETSSPKPQEKKPIKWINQVYNLKKSNHGFCIRCQARIPFKPEKPYCSDCYLIWSQFENYEYQENFCHRCGEDEATTMQRPQCYDCFDQWRQE